MPLSVNAQDTSTLNLDHIFNHETCPQLFMKSRETLSHLEDDVFIEFHGSSNATTM